MIIKPFSFFLTMRKLVPKVQHWEFPNGVPGTMDKSTAFSHAKVPLMGGCLTPTVNIMARANNVEDSQPWAVVEGPTFFGGCMDLCCATKFSVSRNKGKSGDLAIISKKAPNGCCETCVALCTPSDTYNLDFTEGHGMNPQQKAAVIGEMVSRDFSDLHVLSSFCVNLLPIFMIYIWALYKLGNSTLFLLD